MADKLGLESIDRQGSAVVMKFRDGAQRASHAPDPARVLALLRRRPDVTLVPPSSLRLDLAALTRVCLSPLSQERPASMRRSDGARGLPFDGAQGRQTPG